MVEDRDEWFEIPSFAKLNLFLDVLGKREDGYHEIVSVFQTISLHDTIRIRPKEDGLTIKSTRQIPGKNTMEKAYRLAKDRFGFSGGFEIELIKRIPMGGGFGGGSSNAAAFLRFLSEFLGLPKEEIFRVASEVGADVPFFLECGTALVKGKGDIIERLDDLPEYGVVLSVPNLKISTADAYKWLDENFFGKAPCDAMELYRAYAETDWDKMKECSYNVFEEFLLPRFKEIEMAKRRLSERFSPKIVMMTGSGSGVFGILPPGEGRFSFVGKSCQAKELKTLL